jgi:hypothetical protein
MLSSQPSIRALGVAMPCFVVHALCAVQQRKARNSNREIAEDAFRHQIPIPGIDAVHDRMAQAAEIASSKLGTKDDAPVQEPDAMQSPKAR